MTDTDLITRARALLAAADEPAHTEEAIRALVRGRAEETLMDEEAGT
jgi:hypothetical protein